MGADWQLSTPYILLMNIMDKFIEHLDTADDVDYQGNEKKLLTLPNSRTLTTSIRATAQVFEDPKSIALLSRIQQIAPSDANVLIIGETGTGKELIARHVHALSNRKGKPFVAVNCGAFSETLVESELFGHEKGAFTGAFVAKAGWFEAANGGTLFLDEIGDLPLSIQVKLLRVLQEREVVRLGARKSTPIDVRLVAATNVRLEEAVQAGNFREDLFYRLRVAHLELPTLRNRPGDILPLAEYFVGEYTRRLGYAEISLDDSAKQKLLQHSWPGNIRELENVIHHSLLICRNNLVRSEDLHLSSISLHRPKQEHTQQAGGHAPDLLEDALQQLFESGKAQLYDYVEDALVRATYQHCHHNQVQTAKLLGLSRNVLRAKLIKMGAINALK
jgi:transcriptional regulator with PAS, ATPase and Fis domain